ncbi:MAG TPA: AraC family transcriptional regulator [Actinomycetota bacterium]|nr:AraC family transcriptional regulator [Actinomycetota bacterium]
MTFEDRFDRPPETLDRQPLLDTPDIHVVDVRCSAPSGPWSPTEAGTGFGVVFVRSGCFRREVNGVEDVLDPTNAYFERPGDEQRVAHPAGGGDRCTGIAVSAEIAATLWGGEPGLPDRPAATTPDLDLSARRLVASARTGDDAFADCERALMLVAALVGRRAAERIESGRPATARARHALVEDAREAIARDPRSGLVELARGVASSPHHLSRTFHALTGETVSGYRRRLRVRLALERIADGERDLAGLAVELGFADAAHLARTVRAEVGDSPSSLRRELARLAPGPAGAARSDAVS